MTKLNNVDARIVRTRQIILDKAIELLFSEGWNAANYVRLADETGIARGTIYRHWPAHEDLLVEIFCDCIPPSAALPVTSDLHADLVIRLDEIRMALEHTKLGELILAAAIAAPTDSKLAQVHAAITKTSRYALLERLAHEDAAEIRARLSDDEIAALLIGPLVYAQITTGACAGITSEQLVQSLLQA